MKERFEPPFSFVSSAEDWESALHRVEESETWTGEAFEAAKIVAERIWPRVHDTKNDALIEKISTGIWKDDDVDTVDRMAAKLYYLTEILAASGANESELTARTDSVSPKQFAIFASDFEKKS
jgi:hypothetical protein